jgi:uncharacterized Zn-finger protein
MSLHEYSMHLKEEHSTQKSYICNLSDDCIKKFSDKKNYLNHIKLHLKESAPENIPRKTTAKVQQELYTFSVMRIKQKAY